jgi:trans-2,3-dihydro-3-hydroxyanthranilate isomerase
VRRYRFVTLDVFTDRRFGGNPLAVFPEADGISDAEMQALAAEFNLSETTFVLPPADPANTARVRIFNRTAEMPFAGHPNVGTGFVLAGMRGGDLLRFEEIAGLVEVQVARDAARRDRHHHRPRRSRSRAGDGSARRAACAAIEPWEVVTDDHARSRPDGNPSSWRR